MAITDRNNLYGVHEMIKAAKEAGVKPIIGAELTTTEGSLFTFVRNKKGFSRLCMLLSRINGTATGNIAKDVAEDAEGLVVATDRPSLLKRLAGHVDALYAAVTPRSLGAIPTARKLRLPLAALDDATFLAPEDRRVHAVLRAIDLGKTVGTLTDGDMEASDSIVLDMPRYIQSFSSWHEALDNTEAIVSACSCETIFDTLVFPGYPVAGSDPETELRKRVLEGAETRYGELSDAIMTRIDYELDIIDAKGFAPYFLVMDDIVAMASRTCGRGSGAASIVSYALGITNVDPIAHNLYFERFLTLSRTDPPDIDVDFAWDERDEVLRKVIERFGTDRCARVANHNRFRPRSALRETAKAYGFSDGEVSRVERQLYETGPKDIADPLWNTVCAVASRIEGLPRGISMHCGGVVITSDPVRLHAPVQTSAEGYPLLAWEKEGTEAAGLVKIDLLGNRSLAVIRDALANLREEGICIDENTWHPAEDKMTVEALARGDSMGVFYIESPAMRQLQQKTGKGDFAHIVIHSSIIRPAANRFISEYVRRLKGCAWDPVHPRLASILDETYGILCYQEDVSKTAVALASFSEADADTLRRVIAKGAGNGRIARYERQFTEGCRANKVDEETIRSVWNMMSSFDGYSFCKPHSASYAMVSFQSAYLRVHHPAAFMAAVLSNRGGYYQPQAYISEARRMGLEIAGPDVNRSRMRYHAEGSTVVIGFMAITNLSHSAIGILLEERSRSGAFTSLRDAASRLPIRRDDLVALVASGAFDSIAEGTERSAQIRQLLTTLQKNTQNAQGDLFGPCRRTDFPPGRQEPSARRQGRNEAELQREFTSLGFLRDHHPLLLWTRRIACIRRVRACDLPAYAGKRITVIGWPVTRKTVWTREGSPMDFASFEDETALYETVLFPAIHERHRALLYGQHPLAVTGIVRNDQGAVYVEVSSLRAV